MKTRYVVEIEDSTDNTKRHGMLKVYLDDSDKFKEYRLLDFHEWYNRSLYDRGSDVRINLAAEEIFT
jgi:hypothetical protein